MILSAAGGLLTFAMFPGPPHTQEPVPLLLRIFPVVGIAQIGFAVLGLVSGIHFLRLKAWSRNMLEVLTWILLVCLVGFMVYWVLGWIEMASGEVPTAFGVMGAIMGVVVTAIYGVPFGIMLKYLRGPKVKNAINGPA